jgi:ABC-type polysaccharide/polyol phosphate export permease
MNMIVLAFFIIISRVHVKLTAAYGLLIIMELILFSFGVCLLLSAYYLRFRDLSHLWGVVLQLGFWGSPIIYPIDIVPQKYHLLFRLNPMARLIQDFRLVVIMGQLPTLKSAVVNILFVSTIMALGLLVFNRKQKYFAEWV